MIQDLGIYDVCDMTHSYILHSRSLSLSVFSDSTKPGRNAMTLVRGNRFVEPLELCVQCNGRVNEDGMLQCHTVSCRALQYVAVCCNGLQRVVEPFELCVQCNGRVIEDGMMQYIAVCCSVLQCVVVCCSVLQCVVICRDVLQCVVEPLELCVRCTGRLNEDGMLHCAAMCCSILQCVAACR